MDKFSFRLHGGSANEGSLGIKSVASSTLTFSPVYSENLIVRSGIDLIPLGTPDTRVTSTDVRLVSKGRL